MLRSDVVAPVQQSTQMPPKIKTAMALLVIGALVFKLVLYLFLYPRICLSEGEWKCKRSYTWAKNLPPLLKFCSSKRIAPTNRPKSVLPGFREIG